MKFFFYTVIRLHMRIYMSTKLTVLRYNLLQEIYMTTKLTVAPCKWKNDSIKGKCKRKKRKKRKGIFPFLFFNSKQTPEVGNEFSHFRPKPNTPYIEKVKKNIGFCTFEGLNGEKENSCPAQILRVNHFIVVVPVPNYSCNLLLQKLIDTIVNVMQKKSLGTKVSWKRLF